MGLFLTDHSINPMCLTIMARPKEFDRETALAAAIEVFREHGFEATSASMLTEAMRIGRQSLYDTFGDKWQLYCESVARYSQTERQAHVTTLRTGPRAIDGIRALIARVVAEAGTACLGVSSVCEFGVSREELTTIRAASSRALMPPIVKAVRQAQVDGDVAPELDPEEAAMFMISSIAGIRIAARGGADDKTLCALGQMVLRALR